MFTCRPLSVDSRPILVLEHVSAVKAAFCSRAALTNAGQHVTLQSMISQLETRALGRIPLSTCNPSNNTNNTTIPRLLGTNRTIEGFTALYKSRHTSFTVTRTVTAKRPCSKTLLARPRSSSLSLLQIKSGSSKISRPTALTLAQTWISRSLSSRINNQPVRPQNHATSSHFQQN